VPEQEKLTWTLEGQPPYKATAVGFEIEIADSGYCTLYSVFDGHANIVWEGFYEECQAVAESMVEEC
jgi:hypothetical protein